MQHIQSLSNAILANLSDDLLKPQYRNIEGKHPTTGHCYAASEALYHMTGGSSKWQTYCGRDDSGTHWWLKSKETGEIMDLTADQFYHVGKEPPYKNGRKCPFLTKTPSNRALVIIDRIFNKNSMS